MLNGAAVDTTKFLRPVGRKADDPEKEMVEKYLTRSVRVGWWGSRERARFLYWHDAIEQTPELTAEEREERLEQCGGLARAQGARAQAMMDFRQRVEAEQRVAELREREAQRG